MPCLSEAILDVLRNRQYLSNRESGIRGESMRHLKVKKVFVVISIVLLIIAVNGSVVFGSEARMDPMVGAADPAVMAFDFAAARPLGFAALVTGTSFFIASLPFSILGGNTGAAFDKLVADPAKYTFLRPLGGF